MSEAEITTSIEELKSKYFQYQLTPSEDPITELEQIWDYASKFYDEHCIIEIEIPGNEKRKAYSEEELGGLEIVAMPKKSNRKGQEEEAQTGDYAVKLSTDGKNFKRLKIRFERKSVEDASGTIINGWKRFLGELNRAKLNPEIEDFRIVVEGGMLQTLTFFYPYPKICKYCVNAGYKLKDKRRTYYCKTTHKDVKENSNCSRIKVKSRSPKQVAQLISLKRGRIGIIEAMGFPVKWCDTRTEAANYINVSIKEYFKVHFAEILEFDRNVKLIGEDRNTLTFEAVGIKFCVNKDAVKVLA